MNEINRIANCLKEMSDIDTLSVSKEQIENDKCRSIKLNNSDYYMNISKDSTYNIICLVKQIMEFYLKKHEECKENKEYIVYFKRMVKELLDTSKSYANDYIETMGLSFLNEQINYSIVRNDLIIFNKNIDSFTIDTSLLKLQKQDEFSMFVKNGEVYGCAVQHYKAILSCNFEIEDIVKNALKVRLLFLNKLYENGLYLSELKKSNNALEEAVAERTKEIEDKNKLLEEEKNKLNQANLKLVELNKKLDNLSRTDFLTMLSNRRDLKEKFLIEIKKSMRKQTPISLIMADVDFFKAINDRFGHDTGDQVLIKIADIFTNNLRAEDIIARYGGEEFVIILPETDFTYSSAVAERLRFIVSNESFDYEGEKFHVTMSFGLCSFTHEISFAECMKQADSVLYKAKNGGRNRVVSIQL